MQSMLGHTWNTINGNVFQQVSNLTDLTLPPATFIFHMYLSYVSSVIALWNTLPVDIRSSSSSVLFLSTPHVYITYQRVGRLSM